MVNGIEYNKFIIFCESIKVYIFQIVCHVFPCFAMRFEY